MLSHFFAFRSRVAWTLLAAAWLLLTLSLAPLAPARAERVNAIVGSRKDQDDPSGIALNEFMPDPNSDWNDDGTISDTSDEYIEIYNDGSAGDVDLSGWKLDDVAGGGSPEYVFPPDTILRAGRHLVMFGADTRVALNNSGGDTVRLVRPDNSEADTFHYTATAPDQAYSRTIDGGGTWTTAYPPSPGAMNQPISPPTPSPTTPSTATPSPSSTSPSTATPSPSSTSISTATPSPTASPPPTPFPTGISLNEYMPDPVTDWNGNGQTGDADDEYIELYNAGLVGIDLGGWFLDDITDGGSAPYVLPAGTQILPNGFLLVFSAQSHIALNNSGDTVRLIRPDGVEIETTSYESSHADQAYSKTIDGGSDWTTTYPPSPGGPNQPPPPSPTSTETGTPGPSNTPGSTVSPSPTATATPTATSAGNTTPTPYPGELSLNEFMPDPASDWNGNGQTSDADDEYIELYNDSELPADVSGWLLDDIDGGGSPPFALPLGTSIPPGGFLVFFSAQTHLSLNNGGDSVRLVRPDGVEVEAVSYTVTRADQAQSKTVDGGAEWTSVYPPSPGASNQPQPTATPTATAVPTTASMSGHVFLDADGDGQFEPWLGETGLANVLVMLSNGATWMTDSGGWYGFHNLAPGTYVVRQAQSVHTSSTTPDEYSVVLAAGDDRNNLHFGEMLLPPGQVHTPVLLNEFLPSPASDWDGDGTATAEDEWIEIHNTSDAWVDLSGWFLDDVDDGRAVSPEGSAPHVMPPGSGIAPHSYTVVFRSTSGVALNNSGDTVRLLGPGLFELEMNSFGSTDSDISWSKTVDGGTEWTNAYPPSLGSSNQPIATATPTATTIVTTTMTPTVTPTPAGFAEGISLNEYLPDPASDWNGDGQVTAEDEYIEIYNSNPVSVDLSGWMLDDVDDGPMASPNGSRPYVLPSGTIVSARGFVTLFRSESGVVLNNDGDWARLLRPDGLVVEATTYATSDDDGAYSKTLDGGDQWTQDYPPSPGHTNYPSTPTPTVTGDPTPTATGSATPNPTVTGTVTTTATVTTTPTPSSTPDPSLIDVTLNEFMPDPASDWNGDGTANQDDEYVELFNAGPAPVDLGGWMLDDVDDSQSRVRAFFAPDGSQPYVIPAGTVVDPDGFVVFFRSDTDVTLNNDGDWVRLLRPDAVVAEAVEFTSSRDDQAHSKTLDGGDEWTHAYLPSPGRSNTLGGTPTPSPTATPSVTRTPTPSPTPSGTPQPLPTGVSLNEVMPWPASDWNGDGLVDSDDEYIEIYNVDDQAVDLGGWKLDDSAASTETELSSPYVIPPGTILPAKGFLLFFGGQTHVGLNNSGDSVRLLWPNGTETERFVYQAATWGGAFSKQEDGGQSWTSTYPPSPGQPNSPGFTGNERVRLNELLSSPQGVDWDGDGTANYLDEWVELVNLGEESVHLAGWALVEGPDASTGYRYLFPADTTLAAGQYLVIYRGQSHLALDAGEDSVHLLFPDGTSADTTHYTSFAGYDQSWCRLPNGTGGWSVACIETPGRANLADVDDGDDGGGDAPPPPYDRFNHGLVSIAWARTLPDDARVTLEGQVTVLPNIFDDQQIYIQDATGGMLVYLRSGEWPPLSEGHWVRVNGRLDTLYGEKEIKLTRIDDIKTMQPASPPEPRPIETSEVGETTEGWLVRILAPASGFRGRSVVLLDNGGSDTAVVFKQSTGMLRPYVEIGEMWAVVGVVSQDDDEAPFDSGYRILPRRSADVQPGAKMPTTAASVLDDAIWNAAPLFLPVTGAAGPPPSYTASWTQHIRPAPDN